MVFVTLPFMLPYALPFTLPFTLPFALPFTLPYGLADPFAANAILRHGLTILVDDID